MKKNIFIILVFILLCSFGCTRQVFPSGSAVEDSFDNTEEIVIEQDDYADVNSVDSSNEDDSPQFSISAEVVESKPRCGDGNCDSGENCDRCFADCACKSPAECYQGRCKVPECGSKAECDDGNSCTVDNCAYAQHPNAFCTHDVIKECKNKDGCCPRGCDADSDNDCEPVCGNGICEIGETDNTCKRDCEE